VAAKFEITNTKTMIVGPPRSHTI